jgi:four helix bundle protein
MEENNLREQFKKRIYNYMIRLVKFLTALPQTPVIREIIRQLIRSGTSIGANYFEAQAASSKKDYQNFFNHSLKSANESLFWLSVLTNSNLVPENLKNDLGWILNETKELANIFASSILTMKNKR